MRHASKAALVAAVATAALSLPLPRAAAIPFPPPLGPCGGPDCPSSWNPPNNEGFAGRDTNINIFAGGNYTVSGRAAEAEGWVVALGDLTVDKNGGGSFNMGVVGVGSRVPPPNGHDFVTVGGNVTSQTGNNLIVGGPDSPPTSIAYGNLRYGGALGGAGTITVEPTGQKIHDTTVKDTYGPLRTTIEEFSSCAARQTATGTVAVTNSEATFTGDGTSARQVFNVSQNLTSGSGGQIGLVFANIPAGATVVVNMLGDSPTINTYSGTGDNSDPLTGLRPRLMWNFPTATSGTVTGTGQFQGSVMAGNAAGTTTLSTAGVNGRVYLAGNLLQTSGGGGYELHAYPFDGDLPDCGSTPTPTPTPTASPTTSPSPSESASTSPSPSSSPSPSTSGSPSTSPTTGPTASHSGSGSASASDSESGSLPNTGSSGTSGLLGTAGALLIAGAGALLFGRRLSRRRGRHS
ncbi:choice-of-anchor A family protein [Kitasatospora sp. NPDC058965]|uniref:choice-of-anchor A family protein n=1 Tax=Kitasatospora sp. NPDC058965 TaxID=3346682 RepID=UPI0036AD0ACD